MIKLKANGNPVNFEVTKFPDGTFQTWKLDTYISGKTYFKIDFIWDFDNNEIFQLLMLIDLIRNETKDSYIYLNMPYLPYARQDHPITNYSTFSLYTFASLLNSKDINLIVSYDVHSKKAAKLIKNFQSIEPHDFHHYVLNEVKPDVVMFPDYGASSRYSNFIGIPSVLAKKARNQETGEINKYVIEPCLTLDEQLMPDLKDKTVLIVDDLVDGGATFIHAANALYQLGVKDVVLCASHGVLSKGLEPLKAAGISKVYTTNSLVKNSKEFNVWE